MSGETAKELAGIDEELARRGNYPPTDNGELAAINAELAKRWARPGIQRTGDFLHEVPRSIAQNLGAQAMSGYAGIAGTILPGDPGQGARWQQKTEHALSYEPESSTGKAINSILAAPSEYVINPISEAVGSKVAEYSPAAGAIIKGAIQAAPFALGLRGFKSAPESATSALAKKYGMALTPTESGAGIVARTVEGLSGEEKLSKAIARKNAATGARAIAADIGIPADTPLSHESIAAVRRAEHAPYEEARGMGEVSPGKAYNESLDAIEAKYQNAAKSFPDAKPGVATKVMDLIKGLRVDKFDASAGVDQMNALREAANDAYRTGDGGLGKAYKDSAKAIEDSLIEHAAENGSGTLGVRLKNARERIAKTYDAHKALDKEGAINPQKFAQMDRAGRPLSGASKDIAILAENAPRSFRRDVGGNVTAPTWADAIMGGLTGAAEHAVHGAYGGLGAALAATAARPLARSVIASGPYQRFQASNLPGYASEAAQRSVLLDRRLRDEDLK